jgi:hypothetical protein
LTPKLIIKYSLILENRWVLELVTGVSTSVTFDFGDSTKTRDIIAKGIFLENHPFTTNQQISYTSNGTNVSISTDGSTTFTMPSTLYAVKKNQILSALKHIN